MLRVHPCKPATEIISVYWILNLRDRQLEVYTEPLSDLDHHEIESQYQQCQILSELESVIVSLKNETGECVLGQISVKDLF